MEDFTKQKNILKSKLEKLTSSQKTRYSYTLQEDKEGLLPFTIFGKNKEGTILFTKGFDTLKEAYMWTCGVLDVLEGGVF